MGTTEALIKALLYRSQDLSFDFFSRCLSFFSRKLRVRSGRARRSDDDDDDVDLTTCLVKDSPREAFAPTSSPMSSCRVSFRTFADTLNLICRIRIPKRRPGTRV